MVMEGRAGPGPPASATQGFWQGWEGRKTG